ncbi:peptidyl-prolyl cis-trans isomerase [Fictibacillus phosphorivorans]|uniref:peptidyl-prolyl cis-trans isomerase n=1 Tax=Fictibacillus phosphorivorans TaxID=1221500 RepID=UPI0020403CE8|nr:peptidyl-prolyl cis-trans isomerase [Fictibacillus phosphorivorans]MCM3717302.1 peptidyl-prolyl cis-trans isomerase [Fictibacillus phosphorivorans]MCM3774989.1 peptidyl-prolyl cis-trans isomerase [Fictibacillus phosphorivorans]
MEFIVALNGKVNYPLTLDPGVWIFDDRKENLNTLFDEQKDKESEQEKYLKDVSAHWDRELKEGAVPPAEKDKQTPKKTLKETLLTGSFAISLSYFIYNAQPQPEAKKVRFETGDGNVEITLKEAQDGYLAFSENGKPLKEDGPVHFYFGDGSNKENPIKRVTAITVI